MSEPCSCDCHDGGICGWNCCQEPGSYRVIPIKVYGEGRGLPNLSNRVTPKKPSKLRFFLALPFVLLGYVTLLGIMFGVGCAVVLEKLSEIIAKIEGKA